MLPKKRNKIATALGLTSLCLVSSTLTISLSAQEKPTDTPKKQEAAAQGTNQLAPVVVMAETMNDRVIQGPFLPEVTGTNIYAGKKTSVIDFDSMPQIQTDNYRQAFANTPGLLTSELSNSSLLSLSYRGIGDPHESQNLMVLKDGIPFVLDPLGYSTVYFAPPFESLDRLEFVSGGGALLFGAQPSGALNYITHQPDRSKPASLTTQQIFGSDDLYSTFSTLEGGNEKFGYLLNLDHRQGDSFRTRNSDFELTGMELKMFYDIDDNQRVTATIESYNADHGEPGGRTVADFENDRNENLLDHDRVRLDRLFSSVGYELGDDHAKWTTKVWASEVVRYSKRENGQGFGTVSGNLTIGSGDPRLTFTDSNTINEHTYRTLGLDSRVRFDYDAWQQEHSATFGVTAMHVDAPIWSEVGDTASSDRGDRFFEADRSSSFVALFTEHLFRFGKFSVTPGARVEFTNQSFHELQNLNKTLRNTPTTLIDDSIQEVVPLGGLGITYETSKETELYGNISSAYKPATFSDAFPIGGADTISESIEPGEVINYEVGFRGQPVHWANFDASLFYIDYDGRFGRVGSNFQNVGRSVNQGFSLSGQIDLYDLIMGESEFSVIWYSAYQFLDAEFTEGPLEGKNPQYAPDHMLRTGLIVQKENEWKFAALVTHLSDHWADDANTVNATANWEIPAYTVLDLTAEFKVWSGQVGGIDSDVWMLCGLNNALDENYFSRVRANGIDPANDRNYYVGLRAEF
jgi:Fe(3+) dicitrate transport protein